MGSAATAIIFLLSASGSPGRVAGVMNVKPTSGLRWLLSMRARRSRSSSTSVWCVRTAPSSCVASPSIVENCATRVCACSASWPIDVLRSRAAASSASAVASADSSICRCPLAPIVTIVAVVPCPEAMRRRSESTESSSERTVG